MKNNNLIKTKILTIIFVFLLLIANVNIAFASETDGTVVSDGYAWGENMAWFGFAADGSNVHVTDTAITGYAWSHLYGWMNLSPETSGVTNDAEGNLGGYAWSPLGWVDFSGVTISKTGKFEGIAGTQGTLAGRINFSCDRCDVTTDWRPLSVRNKQLFDITFVVDSGCLLDSRKLASTTTFTSFGNVDTPVSMTYEIYNSKGKKVFTTTSRTTIQTEGVYHQLFSGLVLTKGKYTIKMTTLYNTDVKDTFQQSFDVAAVCNDRCLLNLWIVALEVLIIIILLWRSHNKKKKELNAKKEKQNIIKGAKK